MKSKVILTAIFTLLISVFVSVSALADFEKVNEYTVGRFTDVAEEDWFAGSVKDAYEYGIMNGVSDDEFYPDGTLTVAEGITIASRIYETLSARSIPEHGGKWYEKYVAYAISEGFLKEDKFPDYEREIKRSEIAELLSDVCGELPEINSIESIPDVYPFTEYAEKVLRLYKAGILTGNDAYGTFDPAAALKRSEISAMAVRIADPSKRIKKDFEEYDYDSYITFDEALKLIDGVVEKTENDDIFLMKVNSYDVSLAEYRYNYMNYLKQTAYYYGYDFLNGRIDRETFKGYVDDGVKMAGTVAMLCDKNGVKIKRSEFDEDVINSVYLYLVSNYESLDEAADTQYSTSVYSLLKTETAYSFYNALYTHLYSEGGEFYDKIKKETLENYAENDYVRVKHILVGFPDGVMGDKATDEQKEAARAVAEEVLAKAKAGADFDELIAEYNEDPGVSSNPNGYYFGKGQMVKEFEDASYALNEGEISDVVETVYGYHVILRLPIDDASIFYTSEFQDNAYDDFESYMASYLDTAEVVKAEGFDELTAAVVEEGENYLSSAGR